MTALREQSSVVFTETSSAESRYRIKATKQCTLAVQYNNNAAETKRGAEVPSIGAALSSSNDRSLFGTFSQQSKAPHVMAEHNMKLANSNSDSSTQAQ